jgi:hypothetical protein
VTEAGQDDVSADDDAAPEQGAVTDPGEATPAEQVAGPRRISPSVGEGDRQRTAGWGREAEGARASGLGSDQVSMPDEARTQRLTHALHWAQQGASPEVAQERWMRRLAGQSQQRLETGLTDDQVDDVAMLAAWVHSEAVEEGARIAQRRMTRAAVGRFLGTVIGAAIGAGIVQFVVEVTLR